jgi:hypothetical protein
MDVRPPTVPPCRYPTTIAAIMCPRIPDLRLAAVEQAEATRRPAAELAAAGSGDPVAEEEGTNSKRREGICAEARKTRIAISD